MTEEQNRPLYPCDEPEESAGTDPAMGTEPGQAMEAAQAPQIKGKGRRGGNAAASVVVHSGKFKQKKAGYNKPAEEEDRDRGPGFDDRDRKSGFRGRDRSSGFGDSERKPGFGDRERKSRSGDRERSPRFGNGERRTGSEDGGRRRPGQAPDKFGSKPEKREKSPEAAFGRAYQVKISSTSEIGAFVEAPEVILKNTADKRNQGRVLLPFAEQIGRPAAGDTVRVYFYEDKGGRLTATMRTPILKDGEVGILTVAAVTAIGVFLDNGVPKQVLLPFKEQIHRPEVGDEVLVWLYTDKSGRQAASMRVYSHLDRHSPYHEDDRVTGFVYEVNPEMGVFIAVDNKYYGMVPIRETFKEYSYGDEVEARVARVREDGKLDLLIREKLYKTTEEDADVILYELRRNNGFLPYGDRADAAFIEETYAMSKNQFKRALGHLYRNHIVELDRVNDTVRLLQKESKDS